MESKLKSYRKKAKMTLRNVQERTGIQSSYLSRMECGVVKRPGAQIMYTLSKVYKVDFEEFCLGCGFVQENYRNPVSTFKWVTI